MQEITDSSIPDGGTVEYPLITPPPPVYTTTSLLRQYSFDPNVRITESFYFCEDPVNATTVITTRILLPNGNALTGVHCINVNLNYTVEPR